VPEVPPFPRSTPALSQPVTHGFPGRAANLIQSIGYSLGKVHTGLLAYLCDRHREGKVEPLTFLFGSLGVPVPRSPVPKREWQSIDLAIFDGNADEPCILVEMKVDDHDHETRKWIQGRQEVGPQTDIYARAFPKCSSYLYITLGLGQYFHAPYGTRFRWVRLHEFAHALEQMGTTERVIEDWKVAIRREASLHECVRRNDRSCLSEYRSGAWNICFLGQLREAVEEAAASKGIDATCYMWGTRPDTILNFGYAKNPIYLEVKHPVYLEVNNNGRLNLKVNVEDCADVACRQSAIGELIARVQAASPAPTYRIREGGRLGASKTVASFDIGLLVTDGCIGFAQDMDYTLQQLGETLRHFYGSVS